MSKRILVQKFGGTSLATEESRQLVVKHIQREYHKGMQLVVVVSAMGRKGDPYATDTLLEWVSDKNRNVLSLREQDLVLSCGEIISATTLCSLLQAQQISSTVLTGPQAGIMTDHTFGNARILNIKKENILTALQQVSVVIVTGFQGESPQGDVTTLGRGGSDTSATAIGAALQAEYIDIYTDVNGVLTADPRLVEDAQPLPKVSYVEICNMAYQGAKVIHPRAIEIAMQAHIPVRIRSTFSEEEGTLVTQPELFMQKEMIMDRPVTGIAHMNQVTQIKVKQLGSETDLSLHVFQAMAENHISVDFINVTPNEATYTVFDFDTEKAIQILENLGYIPAVLKGCAKVSIIGGGINGVPGIMARIVEALTEQQVPILQSADSNTTIWVLVKQEDMVKSVRALHHKFELHKENRQSKKK